MKRRLNSDFVRNVFALMSGNLLAQTISMGSAPVITRLFTPANFGTFALFMATLNIVSRIGSLCYERAIVLPKKNEDAISVLFLSVVTLILITSTVCSVIIIFKKYLIDLMGNRELDFWILFIPLAMILTGTFSIMRYWRIRNKEFKSVAMAQVGEASVSAITKIAIGLWIGACSGGLITGTMIGMLVSLLLISFSPKRFDLGRRIKYVSKASMKNMARTYKQFPLFASWNTVLTTVSQDLVVFVFAVFFSPVVVGFYALSNRILFKPISLIAASVQNVYFQKASYDLNKSHNLTPGLRKVTLTLFFISLLPFGVLGVFGRILFGVVFGQEWETAGLYVQILAPLFLVFFAAGPAGVIYEVCQKQDLKLILSVCKAATVSAAVVGGCLLSYDATKILAFYVIVSILFEATTVFLGFLIAMKRDARNIQVRGS